MALTRIKAHGIDSTPVYVLNDISSLFDGDRTVFPLSLDYSNVYVATGITIRDSKDLDITINNQVVQAYVEQRTWPWINTFDSIKGFRVVDDNVIFYNAPPVGSYVSIIFRNRSQEKQYRRYPFTAGTIALGD